jgi:hypothetical protein
MADYRRRNPHMPRKARLKRLYGLTITQYESLLEQQRGVCAVCLEPPRKIRLAVDHNHATGKTRGLLCAKCNRAVGCVGDNHTTAKHLTNYIRKHQ